MIRILDTERVTLWRMRKLDPSVSKLEIARMALAEKGVINHWTLTYRRDADHIFKFRNPAKPGVSPICNL
jgi:hypothetical protein